MPIASAAIQRPDLRATFMEFDVEAQRRAFIGRQIFPVFEVAEKAGHFGKIPIEALLTDPQTRRAPKSAYNRGDYELSNRYFETAERVADHLFTRSLSREAASFLTNDEVRPYRGEPFELVFIHYYRALNYWHLSEYEDALVECRKANLKRHFEFAY